MIDSWRYCDISSLVVFHTIEISNSFLEKNRNRGTLVTPCFTIAFALFSDHTCNRDIICCFIGSLVPLVAFIVLILNGFQPEDIES
jgi:hypothetical protein